MRRGRLATGARSGGESKGESPTSGEGRRAVLDGAPGLGGRFYVAADGVHGLR